jgi:hypothetical protein
VIGKGREARPDSHELTRIGANQKKRKGESHEGSHQNQGRKQVLGLVVLPFVLFLCALSVLCGEFDFAVLLSTKG